MVGKLEKVFWRGRMASIGRRSKGVINT